MLAQVKERKKIFTAHWQITLTLLKQDASADLSQSPLEKKQLSMLKGKGKWHKKISEMFGHMEKKIIVRITINWKMLDTFMESPSLEIFITFMKKAL